MTEKNNPLYQERLLSPMAVAEINILTEKARKMPPSGDQTHVLVEDGEDPWVISHGAYFYYCTVDRLKKKILVSRFRDLKDMGSADLVLVWPVAAEDHPDFIEIWSPELQCIDEQWYIYFALYNGQNGQERMFVAAAETSDPQGRYFLKGTIQIPTDRWAIDGSVLISPNGGKYFIWSGWEGHTNISQNIYIARMEDPLHISSERVCISRPEYDWEKVGYPYVNEGPQALVRNGKAFIIYSASGSWTNDYCLGQLTYLGGDLMDPASWHKESAPVFSKTETIFAPGHASFVKNREEDFIVYHAARCKDAGWARQIRFKSFSWKENGYPDFGKPL